ncbi:WD repeat-containing protein 75 [Orussus abietinus]|uniref:WD repeat-containing protein 75 n=1 Tax=Orussus abietinus TaxID=222816 RepID=UPI000625843D|nr:WD repeat-containing protein 75 [Orussus abietinus]
MQLKPSTEIDLTDKNSVDDDLVVKRKGGGSIIDHRPLFSQDGEVLYVVRKQTIRSYSTQTGDFVREFEPLEHKISGISIHPNNTGTIVGCSETADVVFWNCHSGIIAQRFHLDIQNLNAKIKTFHVVHFRTTNGKTVYRILVTYFSRARNIISVVLCDPQSGKFIKHRYIQADCDDYHVDCIGNGGDNLIAVAYKMDLHILSLGRMLNDTMHKTMRTFTCIAGHPNEDWVATGDISGRVLVWRGLSENKPIHTTYHWHTLPVKEIAFSSSGGYMYTGGSECVLVKWTLANPQHKSFLPRLPAPIKHLIIAPETQYVAVSTLDNGIVIVDPHRKLTSIIQNFTWGVTMSCQDLFPAGLTVDPRTNSLVLNSRTGHVQFYDPHNRTLLYNVNITAQNILSQERNAIIVNTEVMKVTLNHDGTWMATVEQRDDKLSSIEVRLKFWKFDVNRQIFVLNTSVELPHEDGVTALQFQPYTSFNSDNPLVVTTGRDKKFKLWTLVEPTSIHKKLKHWQCHSVGFYRNLLPTDATFSMDGSLLGVGFDSTLTIWVPETCKLKCSLSHRHYTHPITHLEFGRHEACHLVVVGSTEHIAVWNLLTLTLMWGVPLKLSTLTADPNSIYMAAFTADNTLFVFTPRSSMPVYTRKQVLDTDSFVLGACFVSHLQEKGAGKQWLRKSQIFFLDSNQELLSLEPESTVTVPLENLSIDGHVPATAFANLMASQVILTKEKTTPYVYEQFGLPGKGMVEQLTNIPAHTLPPTRLLCTAFLTSLLTVPPTKSSNEDSSREPDEDDVFQNSRNESDDEETEKKEDSKKSLSLLVDAVDEASDQALVNHDWSFLSSLLPSDEG